MKKIFFAILIVANLFSSCKKDSNNLSSNFHQLYENLANGTFNDEVTMDARTHEYTFELSMQKEIGEIGYQSQPNVPNGEYIIAIHDNTNNNLIYTATHAFSSTSTSYITPSQNIVLYPNISYTIQRTQTAGNVYDWIGRLVTGALAFPYSNSFLTITGSNFYGDGGPVPNFGIPYIDIVFKQ